MQLSGKMPHAFLFYGAAGTGKVKFAEHFANSLLCENPGSQGHACGECVSCGWFLQYNHPDYRRIRPETLEAAEAIESDEETGETDDTGKSGKKTKTPSKEIKIDQIRAISSFMSVSTHRQGRRVVLMYPAETMNSMAANSLLKTLEEPAPGTVFLLVTNNLSDLLPTILSRCRKFPLPLPSNEDAMQWLAGQGVENAADRLAEQGGAPMAALDMGVESREAMEGLLKLLANPAVEGALKLAENLQKVPVAGLVSLQQRWLYDLFSVKLSGKIRYYPRYEKQLSQLAARAETADLADALRSSNERRAIAAHPLSARLFIEDMLLEYTKIFA